MRYQTCEFERAHRVHLRIYQVYTKNEFASNSKAISKNVNLDELTLTRKIPSGTQLQGFTTLSYMGNHDLCGPPLTKMCVQDDNHKDTKLVDEDGNQSIFLAWFYIGIESGFTTGFLGVCCAIFLNRKLRHAYFKFLYDLRDRLYVMVIINMNPFR
ncbi:hypothetical protein DEO72_LG7g519 [Vigna unguiculata]|uniref:Uncharacterized protein n=1 Tax=Vigna unguiculata TaxID=3917 RepID=A0A4D6MG25_VIGUN|nr:hypothetical protein DEO72_LG7g519 [Vigna unguiculata]